MARTVIAEIIVVDFLRDDVAARGLAEGAGDREEAFVVAAGEGRGVVVAHLEGGWDLLV